MITLVGRPYAFPSNPPSSFDCWTLVKYVRGELGKPCPLPFSDQESWCVPGSLARAVGQARPLWRVITGYSEGAMAVLEPSHVGVLIQGGVLHAFMRNSSVVWTAMPAVRRVWPKAEWWDA